MSSRSILCFSVLFVAWSPVLTQAQDVKKATPLVVRVQSFDELKENVAYFGSLAGHDELKLLTKFIILPAVDAKKPFGLYARLDAKLSECAIVGMVPVTGEKDFIDILALFKIKLTKGADGIYSVKDVPHSLHVRFGASYAYLTHGTKEALAANNLLDPKGLTLADPSDMLSISLYPDRIPDVLKKTVTDWITDTSKLVQQFRLPFEVENRRALRNEFIKFATDEHLMWIKDAGEFTHTVKVDRKGNRIRVEARLAAKPNSKLAGRFADMNKGQSLFSSIVGGDAAMSGAGHFQLPAELRQTIGTAIDELLQHAEKHAKEWHRESDLAILKALVPSLRSGEIDHGFSLHGPGENGFYSFVGGASLKDGSAIEKALRDRIKELPKDLGKHIKLDAEKAGDVKIHRIDLPDNLLKHHAKVFGKSAVYFAFRKDAIIVGTGDKGLEVLKKALAAQPKAAPAGQFSMSVARMAASHAKAHEPVAKAIQQAFGNDKDGGKVGFIVEGGEVVRIRFDMDTSVIKFMTKVIRSR